MTRRARIAMISLLGLAALAPLLAQGMFRFRGENTRVSWEVRTARELGNHSTETPEWTNPAGFERDVFTFARVRYEAAYSGGGRGGGWSTDAPDSDLNLSWRLQQITALRTDPNGRVLRVTDADLADFPFIYIVEPGRLSFNPDEVLALRAYLNNGGFLMLDDFWGDASWENVARVFKQVLPDRGFTELTLDHPLYSSVFKITEKGQIPAIGRGYTSQFDGRTWEGGPDTRTVHHRAILDDKGRIMVFAAHNTDNGDGWEREGEDPYYFENFSLKYAYPLGINLIVYQMTH
jgi:hypothetical protein